MKKKYTWFTLFSVVLIVETSTAHAQVLNEYETQLKAQFDRMDQNKDGRVDVNEFLMEKKKKWDQFSGKEFMTQQQCVKSFYSQETVALQDSIAQLCAGMDKKKNNQITWNDYASDDWWLFQRLDTEGQGFFVFEQLKKGPQYKMMSSPQPRPSESIKRMIDQDLQRVKSTQPQQKQQPINPMVTASSSSVKTTTSPSKEPQKEQNAASRWAEQLSQWLK